VTRPPLACLLALGLAGCTTVAPAVSAPPPSRPAAPALATHCHARGHGPFELPDPRCTPGALDARVTQADIAATICRRGYTRSVRPPEWVTEPQKRASIRAYGDRGRLHLYEYDHLIPLELGGAGDDPRNLWPEPGASPNPKDAVEAALHARVCEGRMPLARAQRAIARDWVALYRAGVR
jgi:hypothetical protein